MDLAPMSIAVPQMIASDATAAVAELRARRAEFAARAWRPRRTRR